VVGDVTKPDAELVQKLAQADVIIDASASVAVSRHLADLENTNGRRVCLFFNPAGTAVVLHAESSDRSVTSERCTGPSLQRLVPRADQPHPGHQRGPLERARRARLCRGA
jgi:hypothetical protein